MRQRPAQLLAVIALSERGTMFDPGPCVYMKKMATSRDLAHLLDLDRPLGETLELIAKEKGTAVGDVMVIMLDRPRHDEAIAEIREAGARIRFIPHGDVSASLIAVTQGSPVDLLWGIGGTPEGVLSAAAIKCIGGKIIGRLWPRNDEERQAALDAGYDLDEVLDTDRLVSGEDVLLLRHRRDRRRHARGVHFQGPEGATTESLVMRSRSGTVRTVTARHDRAKLREITCASGSASAPARLRLRSGARRSAPHRRRPPGRAAPASAGRRGSRSRGSQLGDR